MRHSFKAKMNQKGKIALAVLAALSMPTLAEEATTTTDDTIEEVTVVGKSVSYANNATSSEMMKQQSAMTSALSVIDNLPGVLINEGDTFGSDDWSTTVSIRGFQLSLDEQQIGITVDGIANGNSNYGGGAKANRYIDTENLQTVEVSQGTADVSSRSNEALGGTLNFTTIDPTEQEQMVVSISAGDFDAQKYFVRYETGEIFTNTYAWLSVSSSSNSDWIDGSAENQRDHFAGKFISNLTNEWELKGYVSYDDVHEDNYQRISKTQFEENPEWDRLTDEWAGVPYIDQVYRRGWSTLRENLFGYLQASYQTDSLEVSANIYYHDNEGRGDWVPPYLVDVTDDGAGNPHSEVIGNNTVNGGSPLGRIFFVDASGAPVAPIEGCQSSITFPYGGAGPEYDPTCYETGAVPVGSYRHTNYGKNRLGFNADFAHYSQIGDMGNTLRGGVWWEDYERDENRSWHKIINSAASFQFDHQAYWVQYSRTFNVDTTMFYLEDELDMGMAKVRLGAKKFLVDLEAVNNFGTAADTRELNSDSDTLLSAGIVVQTGIEGLEAFGGYAENFAAVKDGVLERDASALTNITPETSDNIDVGLRYSSDKFDASVTYYNINFDNRLSFIAPDSPDGIDFLIGTNGSYVNVGGIESDGLEASATWYISNEWGLYASYTTNDSTYVEGSSAFPSGNTVFGSAEELAVISLDWARDTYSAGLSTKWVGERWMDAANTTRVDAYTVADFYAGVSLDNPVPGIESLELRLTINNLFDESYLGGIAGQSAWIGAPRTAAVNATLRF